MLIKTLGFSAMLGLVSGCGQINANSKTPSNLTKFNGTWEVVGQTKTASPDAVDECGYGVGNGTLYISGTTIKGEITDNSGYSYELEGTIDSSGKMIGAFTYAGYDAATFDGKLFAVDGSGTWKDIYDCPGSWQVKKKQEGTDKTSS